MGIKSTENNFPVTKEFLEKLLKRKIVDFKTSGGSNPGDNFTSILVAFEIYLENEIKPLHLLFKTFPQQLTRQKLLEDTNLFLKEFKVYDVLIPDLINFQKEFIGNEIILKPAIPKLVAGAAIDYETENAEINLEVDPILNNFLLMEDVRKTYGFKMADKTKSLGYHQVQLVMKELAKFHALSYSYVKHKGVPNLRSLHPYMVDPFFCYPKQKHIMDPMTARSFEVLQDSLGEYFIDNPKILDSFKRFDAPGRAAELTWSFMNPDGIDEEKLESLMRKKPEHYTNAPLKDQWVLGGHGDCWTNNILFKSDDENDDSGKVKDVILVDLQIARESCLMVDITYLMYTSTDTAFRKQYLDEVLETYFNKFNEYCKILKVEPFTGFTLENFKRKFHRSKLLGFFFALIVLPVVLHNPENAANLEDVDETSTKEDNTIAGMFTQTERSDDDKKLLRDRFSALLTELYNEGVL